MEQKNYLKLLWIAGFLGFALCSCWATSESLHLLLPSWPLPMCWLITIGVFIIASLGTKLIVDSLNTSVYMEKRTLSLLGGIAIVLLFWLIFSMPTNAHTFMYRNAISSRVTNDISKTSGYLTDIKNNTHKTSQANIKVNDLKNKVDLLLGELEAEINNEANPGFGTKSKEILRKFAALLSVDKIEPLSYKGTSKQDRTKLYDAYRTKIYLLADSRAKSIIATTSSPNADNLREVNGINDNLNTMRKAINDGTIDLNDAEDINGVCEKLDEGYSAIRKNSDFVNFKSPEDEATYLSPNPVTKVKRMISVVDVWTDFLHGDFSGHGFVIWIILSIIVDVAAFLFFDLAFRKTTDF